MDFSLNKDQEKGQLSFFTEAEKKEDGKLPPMEDISRSTRLTWEKELLGVYLSGHPLDGFRRRIATCSTYSTAGLKKLKMETQVKITGVINTVSMKKDRKGNPMAFFTLEDSESEVEVVVFAKVYADCSSYLKERELVFVEGRVDATADNPKILANQIFLFSEIEG